MLKNSYIHFHTWSLFIVSRGDWLGKSANIKVEDNGAVGYVEAP